MDAVSEFERDLGAAIRARIAPGAQTVIAVHPQPLDAALAALTAVSAALERHGIPRGRQLLIVATLADSEGEIEATAGFARDLGIPAIVHDPERSPSFVLLRTANYDFEINDELREAEAVVLVGPSPRETDDVIMGREPWIFVMAAGLASARTHRHTFEHGVRVTDVAAAFAPDVLVSWNERGHPHVIAS